MKKVILAVGMLALLCVAAGAAYNAIHNRYLERKFPVPGKMYEVNGAPMHLFCIGRGTPTVVLENGLGGVWLDWQKVQPELAKTTRVCSYDRGGLGWSDPQPGLRDAKNIAAQLYSLLQKAGEAGPFVLVGASSGGFAVREFAAMYPTEVAGIVFSDSSVPDQIEKLPGAKETQTKRSIRHLNAMWGSVKQASGWSRVTGKCKGEVEEGLEAYSDLARVIECKPSLATSWLGEADNFERSAAEAAEARCCGDIRLLVISQDPDRPKPGWTAQQIAAQPIWNSLQESLKNLSTRSRRIIARNSKHHVMIDRPDVIINGTRELVFEIRGNTTDPEKGTTVVQ